MVVLLEVSAMVRFHAGWSTRWNISVVPSVSGPIFVDQLGSGSLGRFPGGPVVFAAETRFRNQGCAQSRDFTRKKNYVPPMREEDDNYDQR